VLLFLIDGQIDGAGKVIVTAAKAEDGVRLSIANFGPGIPAGKHQVILERFAGAPGFGLGISFALAVADWHVARPVLSCNTPGLRATLQFPKAG
jgi:signal transduction histidine kinase